MEHLKEKKQCLEDIQNQEEILKTGSVEPKPGTSRKKNPFTKEHSDHGRGEARMRLTALLKEMEVSNKP